jgi:hypothetical protein
VTFDNLDWQRFDVHTILNGRGVGVIDRNLADVCRSWLRAQGYIVENLDFGTGIGPVVLRLGLRLHWVEEFGYSLASDSRNLDSLRDGFLLSEHWGTQPFVLEVHQADRAWREDPHWLLGLLAIAQEHSLCSLALGRRFFILLVLERGSPLVGQPIDSMVVPSPFWRPGPPENWFKA